LAVLLRTGGTTGSPKAVMLTHANLVANASQMRHWFPDRQEAKETILAIVPFFHAFGLTLALDAGLLLAARLVLIPRIVLSDLFRAIDEYRPSVLPGVPSLFAALCASERTAEHDLRSIRVCVSGGAPLPLEVKRRFEAMTGSHLYQGYGLTEASPATHCEPHDGSAPPGSIGLPLPDTDALIVDEAGQSMPAGAAGELIVRGPQVMQGYWNRPEETAGILKAGWLHTGDVARVDEQGYFSIVDRKKDVIITGGEHVYPAEVEELLMQHPKVKDAGVAGVPHPLRGEIVTAFIVLNEGEAATKAEIVHWLRSRLAPYKVPRAVEFRTILPTSPFGKVLRRELAAEEAARLRDRQPQRSRRFSAHATEEQEEAAERPIEDLFSFDDDSTDFMSAESFPASDPPPPPSSISPSRRE
jgi:long-chain acyl-CoA synthetase